MRRPFAYDLDHGFEIQSVPQPKCSVCNYALLRLSEMQDGQHQRCAGQKVEDKQQD